MRGGAQAQLMRAADGHFYIVKFVNNPQHRRVLANELLCARLARALRLPVPEAAIVDVGEDLIAASPGMVLRLGGRIERCSPGLQFGSRLPTADPDQPIYDYLPEPSLFTVVNYGDFPRILLFDKWTCNCNGRQVIFCRPGPRQRMRLYMIDQGFCFNGGEWNFPDSPLRGIFPRNAVYQAVEGWESWEPTLTEIEDMPDDFIYQAGEDIPPEWYGDWEELQHLLEALIRRRRRVRELIWTVKQSARQPFENWRSDLFVPRLAGEDARKAQGA